MKNAWNRLKSRFEIQSDWQAALVLFIFSIAGSSIMLVKKPVFRFIRYDKIPNVPLRVFAYIVFIIPTYYIFLFLWANVLGQGKFFNPLIRKMLGRYTTLFRWRKRNRP